MDFVEIGAVDADIPYFNFTQDAQEIFIEWLTDLTHNKIEYDDEEPIPSKYNLNITISRTLQVYTTSPITLIATPYGISLNGYR